jgi:hypothetical protein
MIFAHGARPLDKQNTGGNIFKVKLVYGISNASFNNISVISEHYIYPAQCAVCVVQRRYHHHHLIKK